MTKIRIDKEKLEIKEFILDSNLFLISSSFVMVLFFGIYLYGLIALFYYVGGIELFGFVIATVVFLVLLVFGYMGMRSIARQKQYIERLSSLYEEIV